MRKEPSSKTTRPKPAPLNLQPQAVREDDAAKYIAMSVFYLRAARQGRGDGPPYARYGRSIRYRLQDLDSWLERRVVRQ